MLRIRKSAHQVSYGKPDHRDPKPTSVWMAGIWLIMAREEYLPENGLKITRKKSKMMEMNDDAHTKNIRRRKNKYGVQFIS